MNKKLLTILIMIILIGLISISGVYASNLIKNFRSDGDGNIFFKRLKLTDEQKSKIEEILKELKDKSQTYLNNIKENIEKEKEILSKEFLDENSLNLIVESQIKNLIDLSYLKKDAYLKIVDILDNEQRKIFPTFSLFFRTKPFIFQNEKVNEIVDKFNKRVKDLYKLGKKLNLTDEQKDILKDMIKDEKNKLNKFIHNSEIIFLTKKLDLTDEQVSKLKELFKNEKDKEKEVLEKIKDNNKKQREVLNSENYDKQAISNLIDEYITFDSQILNLRKELYFEFLKILSLEQRQKSPTSIFFFKLF